MTNTSGKSFLMLQLGGAVRNKNILMRACKNPGDNYAEDMDRGYFCMK